MKKTKQAILYFQIQFLFDNFTVVVYFSCPDASLNPWPTPIGFWPLNGRLEGRDMKPGQTNNDAKLFGVSLNSGPTGSQTGSYEMIGMESSYIEIDNSDGVVGPLNSFTFAMWVYPTNR